MMQNSFVYPISYVRKIYTDGMSEDAIACGLDGVYATSRAEHCSDVFDVIQILKEDLRIGDDGRDSTLAAHLDTLYMDNQMRTLICVALDWMSHMGYRVIHVEQIADLVDICGAYYGFYSTNLVDFLGDIRDVLYMPCEGNPGYAVDTRGCVINRETGMKLRPRDGGNGYLKVRLYGGNANGSNAAIHRLVAKAFCPGYRDGLVVNHIDGDKHNNRAENLEWCTQQENVRHAREMRKND